MEEKYSVKDNVLDFDDNTFPRGYKKMINIIKRWFHKPNCYEDCKYCNKEYGYCELDKEERSCPFFSKPDWCPLRRQK